MSIRNRRFWRVHQLAEIEFPDSQRGVQMYAHSLYWGCSEPYSHSLTITNKMYWCHDVAIRKRLGYKKRFLAACKLQPSIIHSRNHQHSNHTIMPRPPSRTVFVIVPGASQSPSHYAQLLCLIHSHGYPTYTALIPSAGTGEAVTAENDAKYIHRGA